MADTHLSIVVGARPQFIKAAAFTRALDQWHTESRGAPWRTTLIHTGQHYDAALSADLFKELNIPAPTVNLGVGSATHAVQTARIMVGLEELWLADRPDRVVVFGDTNSTSAAALTAAKLTIPVVHIEAGLREHDLAIPEEVNKLVTDHLSTRCYAPTPTAMENLQREGLADKAVLVGDIMLDTTLHVLGQMPEETITEYIRTHGVEPQRFLLATAHRAALRKDPERLRQVFEALREQPLPVLLALHPSTQHSLERHHLTELLEEGSALHVIPPQPYAVILSLLKGCVGVITDSGGLIKEAYALKRPCITIDSQTEWIETLEGGWNIIAGPNKEAMVMHGRLRA
ncbi:MAG: UDP-N-acetylglucosamine 2-epimerase (non-hydrolyzing) [Myxococcota bacterium]